MIDVRTVLKQGLAQLREAHVPSFTLAAELLLLHVLGRDRTWLYAHPEEHVSSADAQRYFALIARRANGEPTQHLTGKQEFWSLEFEVTPDVLIPRPETEHVIEVALDRLAVRERRAGRKQTLTGEGLQIADIGTGSGCIAIALAKELPAATIYATDISSAALAVAQPKRSCGKSAITNRKSRSTAAKRATNSMPISSSKPPRTSSPAAYSFSNSATTASPPSGRFSMPPPGPMSA